MSAAFIDFFTQIFAITFGGLAGSLIIFRLMWPKVESYILKLNAINQNRLFTKEMQQMRFAAYERLLLFAHRIEPQLVILRSHQPGVNTEQFKKALIQD